MFVSKAVENLNVHNVSMLRVKNNDIDSNDNELGIQLSHFNIKPVYFIDDM